MTTRHLSPDELLDVAEGATPETSVTHLAGCLGCRQKLEELRSVIADVGNVDVPEPSPLFWDHLSGRVREAVAAASGERHPDGRVAGAARRVADWWNGARAARMLAPLSALAVAAIVAVLIVSPPSTFTRRGSSPETGSTDVGTAQEVPPAGDTLAGDALAVPLGDDPSVQLISDLAGDLDMETVVAAGLAGDESAEHAVIQMNDSELLELQRLLKAAMAGNQPS